MVNAHHVHLQIIVYIETEQKLVKFAELFKICSGHELF